MVYVPRERPALAGQATPGHLHLGRELRDPLPDPLTARLVVKVIGTPVDSGAAAQPPA